MNWNAKDMNEIALNKIWSEHVRPAARLPLRAPRRLWLHTFCNSHRARHL